MKVYVASSWRNEHQPTVVQMLRAVGHEVYDFRHPKPDDHGFSWGDIAADWQGWSDEEYVAALSHSRAEEGFASDMNALLWCDACVLVQPCGVSAALELGWACGAGKLTVAYLPGIREPDLMFKMADHLVTSMHGILQALEPVTT